MLKCDLRGGGGGGGGGGLGEKYFELGVGGEGQDTSHKIGQMPMWHLAYFVPIDGHFGQIGRYGLQNLFIPVFFFGF